MPGVFFTSDRPPVLVLTVLCLHALPHTTQHTMQLPTSKPSAYTEICVCNTTLHLCIAHVLCVAEFCTYCLDTTSSRPSPCKHSHTNVPDQSDRCRRCVLLCSFCRVELLSTERSPKMHPIFLVSTYFRPVSPMAVFQPHSLLHLIAWLQRTCVVHGACLLSVASVSFLGQ